MGKLIQAAGAAAAVTVLALGVTAGVPAARAGRAAPAAPAAAAHAGATATTAAATTIVPGPPLTGPPAGPSARPGSPAVAGRTRGAALSSRRSYNWSGYAASRHGRAFRLVRATFFVPYLNCRESRGAFSSDWAGLDGFTGRRNTVEQAGIEANCRGRYGTTPRYLAWYEMYPRPARVRSLRVAPGDSVTATVAYSESYHRFRLSLTDNTRGTRFSVAAHCPARVTCPRGSAEVISEAPARRTRSGLAQLPLADYGAVSFAGVAITDSSGGSGGLVSRLWGTTRVLQYGVVSLRLAARPTSIASSGFANYWLRSR